MEEAALFPQPSVKALDAPRSASACLAVSWFQNLFDARRTIAAWRKEYNEERPHCSLGYKTPSEFVAQAAGFYTAEREARDSNAIPCPSRSRYPGSNRRESHLKLFAFLRERKLGAGHEQFWQSRLPYYYVAAERYEGSFQANGP